MQAELGRYRLANLIKDDDDTLILDLRAKLEFQESSDDILHIVQKGETLHTLAATYYQGFPNAATLWWAIADYQPEPIIDPTLELQEGQVIIIPAADAVQDGLFGILEEDNVVV